MGRMENQFSHLRPGNDVLTILKSGLILSLVGLVLGIGMAVWWAVRAGSDQVTFAIFSILMFAALGGVVGVVGGFGALFAQRFAAPAANEATTRWIMAAFFSSTGFIVLVLLALNSLTLPVILGLVAADFVLLAFGYLYVAPRLIAPKAPRGGLDDNFDGSQITPPGA